MTDDWQRRGLGTVLLEVAGARAREEGSRRSLRYCWPRIRRCRIYSRVSDRCGRRSRACHGGDRDADPRGRRLARTQEAAARSRPPRPGGADRRPQRPAAWRHAPDHRRERRRLINPRRPGGTGLCGARPCRARRGLRRASSCRLASIPPPIPVAARPAAISPGLARRRPYSSTTAGHTRSSINSETGSASSHPGPGTTAGRKATYTRLNLYQWVAPRAWHTEMLVKCGLAVRPGSRKAPQIQGFPSG